MSVRPDAAPSPARRWWLALVLIGSALAFVIPLAMRCITMADEGYLLMQSLDMVEGKVLYRDMDAFVTPGIWFLLAATFKLFGASVLISRIPVVLAYVCLIGVSHRITSLVAGPRWGIATVAIMMMCTVWAFPAWTFAFYSPFSVLFGLVGLERLLTWRRSTLSRDLILAGVAFGVSILFKQNYGPFALVGGALAVLVIHLEQGKRYTAAMVACARSVIWLVVGVVSVAIPCIAYFASEGVLGAAFQSLVVHPFEFSGKHDIPYLDIGTVFRSSFMSEHVEMMTYAAQPVYRVPLPGGWLGELKIIERLHVLLYWFPPLIFILGLTMSLANGAGEKAEENADGSTIDGGLLAVIAVCLLLFLGVFPRADFNHLINVYQPVVIAGVVSWAAFARSQRGSRSLGYRAGTTCMIILLSGYFAVAGYWYWGLTQIMNEPVYGERGGVLVSPLEAGSIRFVLRNIDYMSGSGEALLSIPDIAMLNFLSARPMPSAYYNLYEHHIAHDGGRAVVQGAEEAGVKVVVTRLNNFFSDRVGLRDYAPELTEYLDTKFKETYIVGNGEYVLLTRREEPVPVEHFRSILEDCEWFASEGDMEGHLLYRAFYHKLGSGIFASEKSVETVCRVSVPKQGGELVWRFDYRKPQQLFSPTTLRVDVRARASEQEKILHEETYMVEALGPRVYRFPAAREIRVDLEEFAGREIELIFRSTRNGRVVTLMGSRRGFGTNWIHPRIVTPLPIED